MADVFPCGLLEALVVVGASEDSLSQCLRAQAAAGGNSALRQHPEPVILNILAPPFVAKEAAAPRLATAPPLQRSAGFTRSQKRRSFRKPKSSRLSMSGGGPEAGGLGGGGGASHTQPVSVPRELDFNGLPSLCFPEGLRVQSEEEEASFHYLVFTDMSGKRTHGVVLTHSRRLQDTGPLPWASNGSLRQPGQRRLGRPGKSPYLPYAICVISKSPYYTVLRDCLSCLLMELQSTKDSLFEDRIADFAATLALVPCPPPGVLHVSLMLRPLQMILTPPSEPGEPAIDVDLRLPFLCFSPSQVLQILTCLLTERRVVLLSPELSLLTPLAESLLHLLRPLSWRHAYAPVLSAGMLDFLEAPTVFLMGCHSRHLSTVDRVEDLVLVNVSTRRILASQADALIDVPNAPGAAQQHFLCSVEALNLHYDLAGLSRSAGGSLAEARERRRLWQQSLHAELRRAALRYVVDLFRDVNQHLSYEHRVFNSDEFLKSQELMDLPFYTKVLETDMFKCFLKDRLSRKMDAFSRLEQITRSHAHRLMHEMVDAPRKLTVGEVASKSQQLNRRVAISMPNLREPHAQNQYFWRDGSVRSASATCETDGARGDMRRCEPPPTFCLPPFPSRPQHGPAVASYYGECAEKLTLAINFTQTGAQVSGISSAPAAPPPPAPPAPPPPPAPGREWRARGDSSALLASYHYLRGCVYAAAGRPVDALAEFASLARCDVAVLPRAAAAELLAALSDEERRQAERRPELRRLLQELSAVVAVRSVQAAATLWRQESEERVKNFALPSKHLQEEEFVRCVQESGIVREEGTIRRLFQALTLSQQKQVDPDTFAAFYQAWKETEQETLDLDLPSGVVERLERSECVYKVSASVKTSMGQGRLAMTQRRLFLLAEGKNTYLEVGVFRDIQEVDSVAVTSIFPPKIAALRIRTTSRRDEPFVANLKAERDLWQLIVQEMWLGKRMADHHKDPQYLQQAATNVLLMDAVVQCLHSPKAIFAASRLAYFTFEYKNVSQTIPIMTSETLRHKINPSAGLPAPEAVDALLYTPGVQFPGDDRDEQAHGTLWCAVGSGRITAFNATSWVIEQHCIQAGRARVSCMLDVERKQVWVGSVDSTIYILDMQSLSCNKQLSEHRDQITDMALSRPDRRLSQVISSSLNGQVVVWDVATLQVHSQFKIPDCKSLLSIQLIEGSLWCCLGHSVLQTRLDGHRLFSVTAEGPLQSFSCFTVFPERQQLWTASSRRGELLVWSTAGGAGESAGESDTLPLAGCTAVSCMLRIKEQVWVGGVGEAHGRSSVGKLYVVDTRRTSVERELLAHSLAPVRCLCSVEDRYVLSGSGKEDGKVAIWQVI
ncbi:DENN domain-containing protein 3 isoform X1 [Lampetra fluviatilis]